MAAVSGSRRRFCIFSEDTESRRAADGFRVRLEDSGSGLAVGCTNAGRVTGYGEGRGSAKRAAVEELGRIGGWVITRRRDVSRVDVAEKGECSLLGTSSYKKC